MGSGLEVRLGRVKIRVRVRSRARARVGIPLPRAHNSKRQVSQWTVWRSIGVPATVAWPRHSTPQVLNLLY